MTVNTAQGLLTTATQTLTAEGALSPLTCFLHHDLMWLHRFYSLLSQKIIESLTFYISHVMTVII